jgi:hypothetical protein
MVREFSTLTSTHLAGRSSYETEGWYCGHLSKLRRSEQERSFFDRGGTHQTPRLLSGCCAASRLHALQLRIFVSSKVGALASWRCIFINVCIICSHITISAHFNSLSLRRAQGGRYRLLGQYIFCLFSLALTSSR